jgi:hypothetical protein
MHQRLDGSRSAPEHASDLAFRQVFVEAKDESCALPVRQLPKRDPEFVPKHNVRLRRRRERRRLVRDIRAFSLRAPQLLAGEIHDGSAEVRVQGFVSAQMREASESSHESLLDEVLRQTRISGQQEGELAERCCMLGVRRREPTSGSSLIDSSFRSASNRHGRQPIR